MIYRKLKLLQSADRLLGPYLYRHARPKVRALSRSDAGQPIPREAVHRLLVIRPGGLGDAILCQPMLQALRNFYGAARIDLLVETRNAGIHSIEKMYDRIFCYDANPVSVWRNLRQTNYDLIVDTEQYHHLSSLVANSLGPEYLCGFDTLDRGRLQTHSVDYSEDEYEVFAFNRLAEAVIGKPIPFDVEQPFMSINSHALGEFAPTITRANNRKIVVFAPAAAGAYKAWSSERYAEVARRLIDRNCFVILLGGKDAESTAQLICSGDTSQNILNLTGRTTLAQTAGILQRSRLLISADTGVMHLAYGVGVSTVSLFGPGLYKKWAPPAKRHRIVRKSLSCSPCTKFGVVPPCPYDAACMRDIEVDEVMRSAEELL